MKIVSLNIEGRKHLPLVEEFLTAEQADVVCLQELFQVDFEQLQTSAISQRFFAPHTVISQPNRYGLAPAGEWGTGMLIRQPWVVNSWTVHTYHGSAKQLPEFIDGQPNSVNRVVIVAELQNGDQHQTVATTHFTWTPDGNISADQRADWAELQSQLASYQKLIFCGDFNAPRGTEMGNLIEAAYQSHVPNSVKTTLDEQFHYAGKLDLVVDYFLTLGHVSVRSVEVKGGVSDHKAIVGIVD